MQNWTFSLTWKPYNPPERREIDGERGFVLVLVLFMILILTVLMTRFSLRSQAFLRQTETYAHSVSALYIARAAVAIAKVALVESTQMATQSGLNVITLKQPWATPIINYPVDNTGFVSGLIEDESSKLNINLLVGTPGGNIDPHKLLQFTRLFTLVGANPAILPLISQWVTPAPNMTGPPGPYGSYTPSYRNRGGPMDVLSELHQISGMTEASYQALAPYLTVYTPGQVNINTASAIVLESLDPGITPAIAQEIISQRPFVSMSLVQAVVGPPVFANISGDITLSSQIFSVSAVGEAGGTKSALRAVIAVNGMQTQTLSYRVGGNRLLYQIDTLLKNAPMPSQNSPSLPTLPAG